ncbi:MAG: phosphatidylserine decarboxylase [Chloroflexota bacterium]
MPDRIWPFARGSAVTLLVVTGVWLTAVLLWYQWTNFGTGFLLFLISFIWLLTLYFFRDPNRDVIQKPGLVISPGDGEIVEIKTEIENKFLKKEVIRISFFLGLTDVHVQRVPLGGVTKLVQHQPGKFIQAFRPEASEVNEYIAMMTETAYGTILLKQIAGILARRCVNYAPLEQPVATGQRFGLIRFGSRLDLYLPPTAKILVQIGDKVKGGLHPIAQLSPAEEH